MPKQVSIMEICLVVGSYTSNCRPERSAGVSFAEVRVDPCFAERGIVARTNSSGEPQASAFVEHRIVDRRMAVPDSFIAPNWRGLHRLRLSRRVRIAIWNLHLTDGVVHGIEHGQVVAALLGRSVDQTVGVDVRIALVGGDFVVQIGFWIGPIPLGDHDISLDALWPRRRLGRQFALRDPGGPVAKLLGGSLRTELSQAADHSRAGLSGLHAAHPGLRGIEVAEHCGNRPRISIAELVARFTAVGLDQVDPLALARHVR